MNPLTLLKKQRLSQIPWFIALNIIAIILLSSLGIYAKMQGKEQGLVDLFSDPFYGRDFYLGWLTGISEIIWCIAIAICLFTSTLLPRYHRRQLFLIASSLLMTLLFIDDRFRFTLIMSIFFKSHLKVKATVYLLYGGLLIVYSKRFWSTISQTPYIPLFLAFFLFAFSSIADITPVNNEGFHAMLEDGTKLIGLINLTVYFWYICYGEIKKLYR